MSDIPYRLYEILAWRLGTKGQASFAQGHKAARGRNQCELPLEHYWFASVGRWFLVRKRVFSNLYYKAARGRNQCELPLEHHWFASVGRWFLVRKRVFSNLYYKAARGRNQSELPLEHYWFASRWSLNSCQKNKLSRTCRTKEYGC
jgi:hypothetical protein